jgi:hypothetical protein
MKQTIDATGLPGPVEMDESGGLVLNASISGEAETAEESDTVDGFHAAATAAAGVLLALDGDGKLPADITGNAPTADEAAEAVHAESADAATDADTLDTLHAATSGADAHVVATNSSGNAQIDGALTLLSTLLFSGSGSGIIIKHIPRKQTTSGSATDVFKIATTNEPGGDVDAGSWGCMVLTQAAQGSATSMAQGATMLQLSAFGRAQQANGDGVLNAVKEVFQTDVAATDAAVKTITDITVTTAENGEYETYVKVQVDVSGTTPQNPFVDCWVVLSWQTYTTAPVITAL